MKLPNSSPNFSVQETQLIKRLRLNPEMFDRVQSIVDLAHADEGPLKSTDEVEGLLVDGLRQLGHATLSHWATQAEVRVGDQLKSQDATVRSRKKKR